MIKEKISEENFRDLYKKDYKYDNSYGVNNILNILLNKNYNIECVKVMESSADVGETHFQGEYPPAVFLKLYDRMDKSEVSSYGIFLKDKNLYAIILPTESYILSAYMNDPETELAPILDDPTE